MFVGPVWPVVLNIRNRQCCVREDLRSNHCHVIKCERDENKNEQVVAQVFASANVDRCVRTHQILKLKMVVAGNAASPANGQHTRKRM